MKRAFGTDTTKALDEQDTGKILAALKITAQPVNRQTADGLLLMQTCCKRAFIRGAFMAAGSISDPNKAYHFEIVCHTKEQAKQLQELLCGFDTDAKIVERKGHYVVYIKEGAHIVDSLNIMEAYVSLMKLENVRILKEMRNSVNRKVNCETANISKTVNAAVKQIEDIRLIQKMRGLDDLPAQLREMALSLLLDNAVKYSTENGKLRLTFHKQGRALALTVWNTTDPIPVGRHDELFERFYRPDSSRNTKTGGHGIGLSVVHAIATAHKGKISAKSEDGNSLTFSILLN